MIGWQMRRRHTARRRAWPLAVRAQQVGKLPTIGFLGATTPSADGQRFAAGISPREAHRSERVAPEQ